MTSMPEYIDKELKFLPFTKNIMHQLIHEADAIKQKLPTGDINELRKLVGKVFDSIMLIKQYNYLEMRFLGPGFEADLQALRKNEQTINDLQKKLMVLFDANPKEAADILAHTSIINEAFSLVEETDTELRRLQLKLRKQFLKQPESLKEAA